MASTRSRSGGREHARPNTGGVAAEHAAKIYLAAGTGIVVVIAFLALTSVGHVIDAATQHFMLFYAGVFALIALCASVALGLVATDRRILSAGHRVLVQSAHRAASFGAVTFLVIHIITEILAQRVHVIDAVIPFLSPFRTFYIGLGTIASDLVILLVITGIMRGRFNASGKAWRWRAMHYTSYAAFVFGVWHGLLGGRPGQPYVDWSYGFLVAFVLLGLAVRVLSNSLKPKESLSGPPVPMSAPSASAPLRAAAMAAQLSVSRGGLNVSGGQPLLSTPLGAPVLTATALPASGGQGDPGRPYYEPGYEGPPRYLGAPRAAASGPLPRAATGPQQLPPHPSGPLPRLNTGPMPAASTGPLPPYASGPMPRVNTGPMPRNATGPMPRANTGPMPRANTGPMPRNATGPIPQYGTGPMPRAASGPIRSGDVRPQSPRPGTGPLPRAATGPLPQAGDRRQPAWDGGPPPRTATGPIRWPAEGQEAREWTGPLPAADGPRSRPVRAGGYPPYGYPDGAAYLGGPGYPEGAGYPDLAGGRPERSPWAEESHDGGWYPGEPPWASDFAETDPDLRYREPGPGMPGYRGSRDNRYGGDRR